MNKIDINVFTSEFHPGTDFPKDTGQDIIATLSEWVHFKDHDQSMRRKTTDKTESITFLHMIDLDHFKRILKDLSAIYMKGHPHATKEDFKEDVFGFTKWDIEEFTSTIYRPLVRTPNGAYNVYETFDKYSREFLDVLTPQSADIKQFKQYYERVLEVLADFQVDPSRADSDRLSQSQIALIYAYEGRHIQQGVNDKEVAETYGYTAKNSGRKICQLFNEYRIRANRIATPDKETRATLNHKIQLFKSVVPHLSSEVKSSALEDIKSLEQQYKANYS
jgi:hypothetical protein